LSNSFDMSMARKGKIDKSEIRKIEIEKLVDTCAYNLTINENIQTQLGLDTIDYLSVEFADGSIHKLAVTEPVEVRFLNITTSCRAWVMS
jgi:hypothetical protein